MKNFSIAVDGPSGAGKSTITREIAKRIDCIYVDTGALYRAIGLYVLRAGIDSEDAGRIVGMLGDISVRIGKCGSGQIIFLNGVDVSAEIRTPEVSLYASNVSKIPEVRAALLDLQRSAAKNGRIIMDGRDIGTVVLPDATLKIFLTASPEERARRRYLELKEKGSDATYEDVLRDLIMRDKNDSTREIAPLRAADDAVILDTTGNEFEQSVEQILKIITERLDV